MNESLQQIVNKIKEQIGTDKFFIIVGDSMTDDDEEFCDHYADGRFDAYKFDSVESLVSAMPEGLEHYQEAFICIPLEYKTKRVVRGISMKGESWEF